MRSSLQWRGLQPAGFGAIVARLIRGGGLGYATSKPPPLKRRATAKRANAKDYPPQAEARATLLSISSANMRKSGR